MPSQKRVMPLGLDYPLFLLIVPFVVAAVVFTRQRVLSLWGWRRDLSGALRFLAAAGFAVALAHPTLRVPDDAASVAIAVDESSSMTPAALTDAQTWIDQHVATSPGADRVALLAFAGDVHVVQPLTSSTVTPRLPDPASLMPGSTDLGQALRVAAGLVRGHSNPRVVLLSDGQSNTGDLNAALDAVSDVPVDVVPIARPPEAPEIQVESVETPQYVRSGESFDGTAVIDSTQASTLHLEVAIDGQVDSERDVQVASGQNRVTFSPAIVTEGFHAIAVRISGTADTDPNNNVGLAYVVVKPKPRVVVIEQREGEGTPIQNILRKSDINVDVRPPEGLGTLASLDAISALILDDVSATSLSLDQQKTLQSYVRTNGHGLVVLGGLTSYALGGYSDTVLEDTLPVLAKPPEKRQGAQLALVLLIDRSASMGLDVGGVTRLGMAKEAAILTTNALQPEDILGVAAFDRNTYWLVQPDLIQHLGAQNVADKISSLTAEGGDGLYQALKEVDDVLRPIAADLKETVLVDDGQADDVKYDDILAKMHQDNIGLSIAAMGDDIDTPLMSTLARLGQGRLYQTSQLRDIPRIITQEAAIAKRAALVQGTITPQLETTSPILRGIAPNSIPTLNGHIATTPKDTAEVVLASDEGAPLLAQWHYGLGRAVTWTSDLGGDWTSKWSDWNQNALFWEQLVRWVMGPPINRDFRLDMTRSGSQARVTVEDIQDGKLADLQTLTLTLTAPGGATSQVPLRQVAAGQYVATINASAPGAYQVDVSEATVQNRPGRTETNGFVVPTVTETTSFVANTEALRRIASQTGGQVLGPNPTSLYQATRTSTASRWDPIWVYFAALGLLAFGLDVAVRRLRPTTLRALFGRPVRRTLF
jgi:uncharacterized membrane protein